MFGFGDAGGFDFGGLLDALGSLFGGAGDAIGNVAQGVGNVAQGVGDTVASTAGLGNVAGSIGGALNYPLELFGDAAGWAAQNWQPLTQYGLQAGQLGANIYGQTQQAGAQNDMLKQYQQYLNQQQQGSLPQNIVPQATPDRPAPSLVKRQLADAQASGLSGAAPDFLARTAGFQNQNDFNLYRQGGF